MLLWPWVLLSISVIYFVPWVRTKRRAFISYRYLKWGIAICGALLRIDALCLKTIVGPTLDALHCIATCSTPNTLLRIAGCSSPNTLLRITGRPTPHKCALLHMDTIRSLTSYKNPTRVRAIEFLHSDDIFVYFHFYYFYRMRSFGLRKILSNNLKYCLAQAHIYGELIF